MKKYLILFILLFVASGCSKSKLICTSELPPSEEGKGILIIMEANFKNDILESATTTLDYRDKNLANTICQFLNEDSNNISTIECVDTKVFFHHHADYFYEDMTEKSRDYFLQQMEKQDMICK